MEVEPRFEVVWPLARKAVRRRTPAARVQDLSGKTIAEFWDYIFRGDVVYPLIRELLRERYPGIKFIDYSHFGNFHGARSREIVADLAEKVGASKCDAVISGIGA